MTDRLAVDAAARQQALALASFIVEAPAGAGKTELLTQRYLRLLAVVEQPEEVLALTFTNKAATEMRDRILGSLEAAARHRRGATAGEPLPPHKQLTRDLALHVLAQDAARQWQLLDHPGRLRITTLDALCASLARQMPLLSRFGSQPAVAADAAPLYATAARRTLEMVESAGPDAEVVAAALAFVDNDAGRLERLLVAMLGRRDQWLQHAARIESGAMKPEVEAGFAALVERDIAACAGIIDARRQSLLMPLARFAAAQTPGFCAALAEWCDPLAATVADLARWRAVADLLLTAKGELRKTVNKNSGFPTGAVFADQKQAMLAVLEDLRTDPATEPVLAALRGLPYPELSAEAWQTVEGFSRLLRLAAGQLWLAFQEIGEVDFIEIAARAGLALGDDEAPTDLAQALDYRIQHLLVDEFQDTSPSQVALIEKLTRGWQPDDGRTLFVVGDPMQSIYRFRKADVGLFLRVRERGIGDIRLQHLRLYRNNRSYPAVVDWVNGIFPGIFPAEDSPGAGAVRYAESAATRPARVDAAVTLHALIGQEGDDVAGLEARQVLHLIEQARAAAPAERIAVLVRARSHLDALVAEIRRSQPSLRFQAVDIEGLDGRQHVQDLLTLFQALHHRADRVHWLALLRAPWCGLRLADLHALAAGDNQRTLWQLMHDPARLAALSDDGRGRLLHLRQVLQLAFDGRGRQSPRRWLEATWRLLGGSRTLESPAAQADIDAFWALVDTLVASGKLTVETLVAQTAELFAPVDPEGEAVQMMTIHKSKGLEFDTVIVLGLHREAGHADSHLLLWDEVAGADGHEHLLVAPMQRKGARAEEPTAYDYLRQLEAERSTHEDGRLLYVAATRAIRCLHLLGVAMVDAKKPDGLKAPAAGSLLRRIWDAGGQASFAAALGDDQPPAARPSTLDPARFVPPLLRLRAVGLPPALAMPPDNVPAGNPLGESVAEAVHSLETAVGTLVHRYLELIGRQGLAQWPVSRLPALLAPSRRWLAGEGFDEAASKQGADDVQQALAATLNSVVGRWVLAPHAEAGTEQAWSTREGGASRLQVIDRCFVVDGCRWIIDYKTARLPEAALMARAASYRPQLQRYAALFAADPMPCRLGVFFPLQAALIELSSAGDRRFALAGGSL